MKMHVETAPQAQSFWASVEIPQSEVQEKIQQGWEQIKLQLKEMVSSKGGPLTQTEAEEVYGLYSLYKNLWRSCMWEGVTKHLHDTVCYVSEMSVGKEGDRYAVRGIFYLEPKVTVTGDGKLDEVVGTVKISSLNDVTNSVIIDRLETLRNRMRYSPVNLTPLIDGKPLALDDVCVVESVNTMQVVLGKKDKVKAIVKLGENCPAHIKDALLGKSVGDDVVLTEIIHDEHGGERRVQVRSKVISKVDAPPISDELICKEFAVNTFDEVAAKIKLGYREEQIKKFPERLLETAMRGVKCEPVPGVAVWDRAEGAFAFMMKETSSSEDKLLKNMGVSSKDEALHKMLPQVRRDYVCELLCKKLAEELAMWPADEQIKEHCETMHMDHNDPQVFYIAGLDLCMGLVLKYYEGRALQDERRIILPGEGVGTGGGIILPGQAVR